MKAEAISYQFIFNKDRYFISFFKFSSTIRCRVTKMLHNNSNSITIYEDDNWEGETNENSSIILVNTLSKIKR